MDQVWTDFGKTLDLQKMEREWNAERKIRNANGTRFAKWSANGTPSQQMERRFQKGQKFFDMRKSHQIPPNGCTIFTLRVTSQPDSCSATRIVLTLATFPCRPNALHNVPYVTSLGMGGNWMPKQNMKPRMHPPTITVLCLLTRKGVAVS